MLFRESLREYADNFYQVPQRIQAVRILFCYRLALHVHHEMRAKKLQFENQNKSIKECILRAHQELRRVGRVDTNALNDFRSNFAWYVRVLGRNLH